eukprot:gene20056-22023_t
MEEAATDYYSATSNGNDEGGPSITNLTIPSEHEADILPVKASSGNAYMFGLTLEELFHLSLEYYKKGKKVLKLAYEDKLQLVAYYKQISCGKYDSSKMPDIGYFDVVGNDRRKAWQNLGDMSSGEAMRNFCNTLQKASDLYEPYMEAQKRDKEERERKIREELERRRIEEEERKRKEEEQRRIAEEEQRQRQLAEELARQKLAEEVEAQKIKEEEGKRNEQSQVNNDSQRVEEAPVLLGSVVNGSVDHKIAQASLWTRPKLTEFIQHVKRDASSIIVVGRGETVTIRVPTHEHGSCLFWEFATESYDVGFGVYFEWSISTDKTVLVSVEDSDEEDTESPNSKKNKPIIEEVLPVLRRNSHEEVIVGSHMYPGQGVYLLKFDNSYSLLRSKTLYYRIQMEEQLFEMESEKELRH